MNPPKIEPPNVLTTVKDVNVAKRVCLLVTPNTISIYSLIKVDDAIRGNRRKLLENAYIIKIGFFNRLSIDESSFFSLLSLLFALSITS